MPTSCCWTAPAHRSANWDEIAVVDDEERESPTANLASWSRAARTRSAATTTHPKKTPRPSPHDGFYRMGDIVRKRGRYVYTEGRRKDLINRGGEKISCDEIENLIFAHPAVKAVSACGDAGSGVRRKSVRVCRAQAGRRRLRSTS